MERGFCDWLYCQYVAPTELSAKPITELLLVFRHAVALILTQKVICYQIEYNNLRNLAPEERNMHI